MNLLNEAEAHHHAGRLQVAKHLYEAALSIDAKNAAAHHGLGVLEAELGQFETGLAHLQTALEYASENGDYWLSFAQGFLLSGRADDALVVIEQALANGLAHDAVTALYTQLQSSLHQAQNVQLLELLQKNQFLQAELYAQQLTKTNPYNGFAWKVLGTLIMREFERIAAAVPILEQARQLLPQDAEILSNLAKAYQGLEEFSKAVAMYAEALQLQPENAEIWNNQGVVQQQLGQWESAFASHKQALTIKPNYAKALNNLGAVLQAVDHCDEALFFHNKALAIKPNFADAHYNRGCALWLLKRWHEAQMSFEQALAIKPDHVSSLNNCGLILMEQGYFDEALNNFVKASHLEPNVTASSHNILFCLNYHPDKSSKEIFAAYRAFDQRFSAPQRAKWRTHLNSADPERRLRVGYVSPDFKEHSMRYFLEPVFAQHNKEAVEIIAYAELKKEDALTQRYQNHSSQWVPTFGMSDAELVEKIRADNIDILVDLAGHSVGNRMNVFAQRPAPVSISWLGYGYTTGLTAIDYFLTDDIMVPVGSEALFSEQPWRIAVPSMVYRPDGGIGEVNSLPALERGFITFGTLTRGIRINHRVIRVWSSILQRLPHSRLVVNSDAFNSVERQQALADRFAVYGIAPEQLIIGFNSPPYDVLRGIDIALDCFPHNSGTTLVESLYLGLPFVTLADRPSVGRIGSMILHGAGHPEWIAHSEKDYIEKVIALASDLPRLAAIRATLRNELEASPWRDEVGLTRRIEQAYREMWRQWCVTAPQ